MEISRTDRRTFMRRGAMGAGAMWMVSLEDLAARAGHRGGQVNVSGVSPYGPISPKVDESTGLPLLQLPDGFKYWSFSWTGDLMSDGIRCPSLHDGMAVVDEFFGRERRTTIRRHATAKRTIDAGIVATKGSPKVAATTTTDLTGTTMTGTVRVG
jgi:uncharacterized protein